MRFAMVLTVLVVSLSVACGDDDGHFDAGRDAGPDAGLDGSTADAGREDGAVPEGGAPDAGPGDASVTDGSMTDGSVTDGSMTDGSATDGAVATTDCARAGGACVAVVPGACADGVVGSAELYACGGGLGVLCCLPRSTPPACRAVGTRSEGWYRPDGTRICYANCAGHTATCEAIGTRSEGWYADADDAACGTIPVERLIEWTFCAS